MYAFFPLLLMATAAAMLGAWLMHDARLRRAPLLAWPGRLLVAVLPLVLLGMLAGGISRGGPLLTGLLGAAGVLLALAALTAAVAGARLRRQAGELSLRAGLLGPTLLVPALGAITCCFVLSLLLALSNGSLRFR